MRLRLVAGSDIARLGVWDAARLPDSPPHRRTPVHQAEIQADANNGVLYIIETGADGTDTIDLYVDECPPPGLIRHFCQIGEKRLLVVASGKIRVDGLEYYRAPPETTPLANLVELPSGDYGITCWANTEEEVSGGPSEEALRAAMGEAEHLYYRRRHRHTGLGCLGLLLFPVLWPWLGWKWSLAIAGVVVLGWFHFREWWLKRDLRFQAARRKHEQLMGQHATECSATMILVLRRLTDRNGLTGGSVRRH